MSSSLLPPALPSHEPESRDAAVPGAGSSGSRWAVHAHDVLGSTNDEARRLALQGAPDGTAVWARVQTAGRGRRGRSWSSPEGNLHMSVVVHCAEAEAPQLGFVAALAVADAVDEACGRARARLKWPNDVLLEGAKLAGLLLEVEHTPQGAAVVLGIGVNLRWFPDDAGQAVTSLRDQGVDVAADMMVACVLRALGRRVDEWRGGGFALTRAAWVVRGHREGDALRISAAGGKVDAVFVGLDRDGSLLALVEGRVERFTSAEIVSD